MSVGQDPSPPSGMRVGPDVSGVAIDLDSIFAAAGPVAGAAPTSSKVRTVAGRRPRLPYATVGVAAAAGLLGLTVGTLMMHPLRPPTAVAQPAPVLPVQVAAPTVSLSAVHPGPIPVLDNAPVAP